MNKRLEDAFDSVRALPVEDQDRIAELLAELASNGGEPEEINPGHLPGILRGLAQVRARQFATDEEIEAALRRFDP